MTEVHITLYGDHAERFEEIREEMEEKRGMEMCKAQALRELMARYPNSQPTV